jgi:hypothetical protein
VSWEAVTAVAAVVTSLVIVVTAIVGFDQLKLFGAQRQDTAAVELVRSIQDDAFVEAYQLVYSLPIGIEATELRAKGDEYARAALTLGFRFEMLGVLVHRGAIPFDIVEDLVGGAVVGSWRRLGDTVRATRTEKAWPMYLEWFQWLAEQFESRDRLEASPAFVRLKDWRPPNARR